MMKNIRRLYVCLPVLLMAWCFLSPKIAGAKPPIPPTPDYNCVVAGHPWAPVYQDLKGIGLFVEVSPNSYMEAVACHGRENACADNAGVASESASARAAYIRSITDDYNAFPPSLHYDNLVRVFTEGINARIQPFVIPENCKRPPIAVQNINDLWLPPGKPANKDMLTRTFKEMPNGDLIVEVSRHTEPAPRTRAASGRRGSGGRTKRAST